MRKYELTYIVKPDLDPASQAALIERVNGLIVAEGGSIVKTTSWGTRQLTYPIRRYREGVYMFLIIELEATALVRLEQRLRLIEDILRYLLVRAEEGDAEVADVMGGADMTESMAAEAPVEAVAEPAPVEAAAEPVPESVAPPPTV